VKEQEDGLGCLISLIQKIASGVMSYNHLNNKEYFIIKVVKVPNTSYGGNWRDECSSSRTGRDRRHAYA
jgi:hypothetical protein